MDLSPGGPMETLFRGTRMEACIHLAAWTDVDGCERNPSWAREANVTLTAALQKLAGRFGVPVLLVSTDYVFSGDKGAPYTEADVPDPLQVYGQTKRLAEEIVLSHPANGVVRCSVLYGAGLASEQSWLTSCILQLASGRVVRADDHQIRQWTRIEDVVDALLALITSGTCGLWHVAASQGLTQADVARQVRHLIGAVEGSVVVRARVGTATRPPMVALDSGRYRDAGFPLPANLTGHLPGVVESVLRRWCQAD